MYLFAFVFLMMGVIGLYTQVYTLQASRTVAAQTGMAEVMRGWHIAANAWALAASPTNASPNGCCVVVPGVTPPTALPCGAALPVCTPATVLTGNYLPSGFTYFFTTLLAGGLVVTWTEGASGFTSEQIYQQLANIGTDKRSYGMITGTPTINRRDGSALTLPAGVTIPVTPGQTAVFMVTP